MRYCLRFLILTSLFAACTCYASIMEALPPYSVMPELNGLNIAYFAQQDKVKITLYLVNHEQFPVTCDAEYQGGPDTEDTREQTIMPDKAIAFTFAYPRKTDSISLQFICIKPVTEPTKSTTSSSVPSGAPAISATPDSALVTETDLSIKD